MSRTGNPSSQFPKSKGKLDDAEMEMDDLDEDQPNVVDDGEEEFDDQDQEGFRDLDDDDQDPSQNDSRALQGYRNDGKPPQSTIQPVSDPKVQRDSNSGSLKLMERSNIRDDYTGAYPNMAPKQPTGSQEPSQQGQRPVPRTDLTKPRKSNEITELADANRAFGKSGNTNHASKADNLRGQSPQSPPGNPSSDHKKQPEAVTYDSDPQFQKYLASLTEYDRSRYNQLLKKNVQLREELKKIADQTEELIKKER